MFADEEDVEKYRSILQGSDRLRSIRRLYLSYYNPGPDGNSDHRHDIAVLLSSALQQMTGLKHLATHITALDHDVFTPSLVHDYPFSLSNVTVYGTETSAGQTYRPLLPLLAIQPSIKSLELQWTDLGDQGQESYKLDYDCKDDTDALRLPSLPSLEQISVNCPEALLFARGSPSLSSLAIHQRKLPSHSETFKTLMDCLLLRSNDDPIRYNSTPITHLQHTLEESTPDEFHELMRGAPYLRSLEILSSYYFSIEPFLEHNTTSKTLEKLRIHFPDKDCYPDSVVSTCFETCGALQTLEIFITKGNLWTRAHVYERDESGLGWRRKLPDPTDIKGFLGAQLITWYVVNSNSSL